MNAPKWARLRRDFLRSFLSLGATQAVIAQARPPVPSDFGGGGPYSPIVINSLTGEAWIYMNGQITPLGGAGTFLTPEAFGAVGNGTTDDTVAFQSMAAKIRANGGGTIVLTRGKTYLLFMGATSQTFAMDFSGCTNAHIVGNGATLTSALVNPAFDADFFYGSAISGFTIEDLTVTGGNTTLSDTTGEHFLRFAGGSKNIRVANVTVNNCNAGVQCLDNTTSQYGIVVVNGYFSSVFYPLSLWACYDVFAQYKAVNSGRAYFPVAPGARHKIFVEDTQGLAGTFASSSCLMKVYADSTKTVAFNTLADIELNYYTTGRAANALAGVDAIIQMDIQQLTAASAAGHFDNIRINAYIDGAGVSPGSIFGMDKYDSNGNADATARGHTIRNITITGVAKNWNNNNTGYGITLCNTFKGDNWTGDYVQGIALRDITIQGAPATASVWANGQGLVASAPFLTVDNVNCDGALSYNNMATAAVAERNSRFSNVDLTDYATIQTYVPTWASSGTQPVLGNGTIIGTYRKQGRWVDVTIQLTPGSSTTFGTGTYTITLPFTSSANSGNNWLGSAEGFNSGVAYETGFCTNSPGNNTLAAALGGAPGNNWGATVPWTFKNGDFVAFQIRYPIA